MSLSPSLCLLQVFFYFFKESNKDLILLNSSAFPGNQRRFEVLGKMSFLKFFFLKQSQRVDFLLLGSLEFIKGAFLIFHILSPSREDICFIVPRISQIRDLKCELCFRSVDGTGTLSFLVQQQIIRCLRTLHLINKKGED